MTSGLDEIGSSTQIELELLSEVMLYLSLDQGCSL